MKVMAASDIFPIIRYIPPTQELMAQKQHNSKEIRLVFGALLFVLLLAALDQTIVSTALPTIVGELGGVNHLSWIVTAYLLTSTVSAPLYGKLADLYGRKAVLQVAIVIFLFGSALCGMSQSMLAAAPPTARYPRTVRVHIPAGSIPAVVVPPIT